MADYKDILSGTLNTLVGKAKEIAASDTVTGLVEKAKGAVESSQVRSVYAQGTARAKTYGRIAKLSLENNGQHEELQRVFTEIGKLYYEQVKDAPEGYFAPLFQQAKSLEESIERRSAEIAALKEELEDARAAGNIDVEITQEDLDAQINAFDQVVDATASEGAAVEEFPDSED